MKNKRKAFANTSVIFLRLWSTIPDHDFRKQIKTFLSFPSQYLKHGEASGYTGYFGHETVLRSFILFSNNKLILCSKLQNHFVSFNSFDFLN